MRLSLLQDLTRDPNMIETYYRWMLFRLSTAHTCVGAFVERKFLYSSWTEPTLPILLQLQMPVAFFCKQSHGGIQLRSNRMGQLYVDQL